MLPRALILCKVGVARSLGMFGGLLLALEADLCSRRAERQGAQLHEPASMRLAGRPAPRQTPSCPRSSLVGLVRVLAGRVRGLCTPGPRAPRHIPLTWHTAQRRVKLWMSVNWRASWQAATRRAAPSAAADSCGLPTCKGGKGFTCLVAAKACTHSIAKAGFLPCCPRPPRCAPCWPCHPPAAASHPAAQERPQTTPARVRHCLRGYKRAAEPV